MRPALPALALLLAGCLAAPQPVAPSAAPAAAPLLRCAEPCAGAIGAGDARPWEPSAAVDPTDPLHLLVGNAVFETEPATGLRTSWLTSHVSFDGGRTWEHARLPGGPSAGLQHPLATANAMGDAVVGFLPDGTALFAGLAFRHVGQGSRDGAAFARDAYTLFVMRSADGGRGWGEVSVVRQGSGFLAGARLPVLGQGGMGLLWDANDKPWFAAAADGTLLMTWAELFIVHPPEEALARQDIVASVSNDGGATWSPPRLVERGGNWLGASPAILADGTWAAAYVDILRFDLHVATSRDEGRSWQVQSVGRAAHFPSMASDGQRLWLAFAGVLEDAASTVDQDAKRQQPSVVWSDDDGASWSAPLVLDTADHAGRTTPMLAAGGGRAYATYFHALGDDAAELRALALGDGGASDALVLATARAPASLLGDYSGLAATPDGLFAAWVTARDEGAFGLQSARAAAGAG